MCYSFCRNIGCIAGLVNNKNKKKTRIAMCRIIKRIFIEINKKKNVVLFKDSLKYELIALYTVLGTCVCPVALDYVARCLLCVKDICHHLNINYQRNITCPVAGGVLMFLIACPKIFNF